ncbi:hypothetical protein FRX31_008631 [Thalictrum thalictroides]|uniref:Uncharacterized protein n=1 Tax=Thalictrum thalictroides TaxID=46969 RepID=A0A7J6WYX6_THATH|nr:hypothetical protein FRX31_008631 [Thalictrum thalictroides]
MDKFDSNNYVDVENKKGQFVASSADVQRKSKAEVGTGIHLPIPKGREKGVVIEKPIVKEQPFL